MYISILNDIWEKYTELENLFAYRFKGLTLHKKYVRCIMIKYILSESFNYKMKFTSLEKFQTRNMLFYNSLYIFREK